MAIPGWATLSQAARDAAYNNNLAVADSAALIERRNAASAAFRKQHPAGLDVPYGPGPRQRWDLFAANSAAAPCLVFIHGGYWQRNTREDFAAFAEGVMSHGWSAAMVGYTLAPDVSLKAIVGEIGQALDWLGQNFQLGGESETAEGHGARLVSRSQHGGFAGELGGSAGHQVLPLRERAGLTVALASPVK